MDDFSQSREPDDLFSDDIEPTELQVIREQPASQDLSNTAVSISQQPHAPKARGANTGRGSRRGQRNGLAFSVHADPSPETHPLTSTSPTPQVSSSTSTPPSKPSVPGVPAADESRITSVRGDRSATGPAKPTKKTEAELSELMKAMQLKNAAKSEAHARAEKDQASFMKREQAAATKRTEERKAIREQDMERAKNRERKIKAQGGREWDSEKQETDIVDGKNRGASSMYSRGAHGGITGRGGGLAGSRFGGVGDGDDMVYAERGGRGIRGRGIGDSSQGGRGGDFKGRVEGFRGGRGGRGRGGQLNNTAKSAAALTAEIDFPALPKKTSAGPKVEDKALPPMSPVEDGNWAEEMATPAEKS